MADEHERGNVVCIPGAMLGPWIWDRVRPLLPGGQAVAPDLRARRPNRQRPSDARLAVAADELVEVIESQDLERPVLVGHSLGGAIAWEACRRLGDRTAGLVLVAAEVPAAGRSWLDEQSRFAQLVFRAAWAMRPRGIRPPGFVARRVLGHDLDEDASRMVADGLRPEPPGMYTEPIEPFEPGFPVLYVRTTADRAVAVDRQDAAIERVGATRVIDLDTGHLPMLARPRAMADAVLAHPALPGRPNSNE